MRYDIERPKPQADLQPNPAPIMGKNCAATLTTLELLDAVEAGIASLDVRPAASASTAGISAEAAARLRAALELAGLTANEFARAAAVPAREVDLWLACARPVPEWAPAAIRLILLLTPSALRKLVTVQPAVAERPAISHPYSRIEDL